MIPLSETCTCGRAWIHCKTCGSKSIYYLTRDSEAATRAEMRNGRIEEVKVFKCKIDGHLSYYPFEPCKAASMDDLARLNRMYKGRIEIEPAPKIKNNESIPKESPITQETISLAELIGRSAVIEPNPKEEKENQE